MATPSSSAPRARNGVAPQPEAADRRSTAGIIGRMLAYRDWWNLSEGRRPSPARNRARSQAPSDKEADT